MKIALINNYPETTGLGRYAFSLFRELEKLNKRNEIRFLLMQNAVSMKEKLQRYFTLKKIPVGYQIYHLANQELSNYVLPLKKKSKVVVTVHDLIPFKFPSNKIFFANFMLKHIAKKIKFADKIIAVSECTKRSIMEVLNIPKEKIEVIYEAAEAKFKRIKNKEQIEMFREKNNLPSEFMLYIGSLEPRKNWKRLLYAFNELVKKGIHKEIKLVMVCRKDYHYHKLAETIERLKLNNQTILLNPVPEEDLPLLYNSARLFVFPSLYEGFGLPVLEAMQCGCPVITSNISSLPEVVGDAAITIDPYKTNEIVDAMLKVAKSPSLRKKMIKAGFKQAKKFSWKKTAIETLKVYEKVCKEVMNNSPTENCQKDKTEKQ